MDENGETPENGENRENGETAENCETLKTVKLARALPHNSTTPACETLKHKTPPAPCSSAETVKHIPGRRRGIAPCTVCETLKQRRKIQASEGVTCFTPASIADPSETAPHPYDSVGETLKRPDTGRIARETVKHPGAGCTGRETLQHLVRRPQAPSRARGHETVKRLKPAPPPKRAGRWPGA